MGDLNMQLESEVVYAESRIPIVALKGRLIAGPRLTIVETEVKAIIRLGAGKLIIDLAEVDHADSSGFCLLLHAYTALKAQGGLLRISGPNQHLRDLFRLTETDTILSIHPDRETSLKSLRRKATTKPEPSEPKPALAEPAAEEAAKSA